MFKFTTGNLIVIIFIYLEYHVFNLRIIFLDSYTSSDQESQETDRFIHESTMGTIEKIMQDQSIQKTDGLLPQKGLGKLCWRKSDTYQRKVLSSNSEGSILT